MQWSKNGHQMSDTFCPIPWNFQAIRNNGDIRVCCQANITANKGVVRHSNGKPYNAATDSLTAARNATLMKDVRKNMMLGEWSPECQRCKEEEKNGLSSRRTYELKKWNISLTDVLEGTNQDGSIDTKLLPLTYYDLRFGNMCNLACRMCGPEDSHTWYEQWSKFTGSESFEDTHGIVKLERNSVGRLTTNDYNWHGSETFWEQIENNISNIQKVYMAGGEPLLIERHYEFLNTCVKQDVAKNIELEYNTNGTLLPNKVISLWKHFKQVGIGVSIDGIGDVVEYQRWPAKWSQLHNNLEKFNKLAIESPNISVWLAVTITAYNVLHIADMIEWKIFDSNLSGINVSKHKPIITPHIAHRPETTNIRILPAAFKNEVQNRYAASISTLNSKNVDQAIIAAATSIYGSIMKYMMSEDWGKRMSHFIELTNFLDSERNQDIANILPSLAQYFKKDTT
jgi:sulfatase maturation enzyme AslB (radical SAM superfamily)